MIGLTTNIRFVCCPERNWVVIIKGYTEYSAELHIQARVRTHPYKQVYMKQNQCNQHRHPLAHAAVWCWLVATNGSLPQVGGGEERER